MNYYCIILKFTLILQREFRVIKIREPIKLSYGDLRLGLHLYNFLQHFDVLFDILLAFLRHKLKLMNN